MGVLAQILSAFLGLLNGLLSLYTYVIFAAIVISWVNADPYNPIVRFIRNVTDPVLIPARRLLWNVTVKIQLDLSPMLVIFGIIALQIVIGNLQRALVSGF